MSNDLKSDLQQFTGTEVWYRHNLFHAFAYTEGVQYLAEHAGAYWLLDRIFGNQYEHKALKRKPFQVWDLIRCEDHGAWLIATDGNNTTVFKEKISFTDFPLSDIRLFLTNAVLLLPSEY